MGALFSGRLARVSIFAGSAEGLFPASADGLIHVAPHAKRDPRLRCVRSQKRHARPRSRHAARMKAEVAIVGNSGALRLSTKRQSTTRSCRPGPPGPIGICIIGSAPTLPILSVGRPTHQDCDPRGSRRSIYDRWCSRICGWVLRRLLLKFLYCRDGSGYLSTPL